MWNVRLKYLTRGGEYCGVPSQIASRRGKQPALGLALAKIHNFCIEKTDITILPVTTGDEFRMIRRAIRSIPLDDATVIGVGNDNNEDIRVPRQLLGA